MHEANQMARHRIICCIFCIVLFSTLFVHPTILKAQTFQPLKNFEQTMGSPKYYLDGDPVYQTIEWRHVVASVINNYVVSLSVYITPKHWEDEYKKIEKLFGKPVINKWWWFSKERIYISNGLILHTYHMKDGGKKKWLVMTMIHATNIPTIPLMEVPDGSKADQWEATLRHRRASRKTRP